MGTHILIIDDDEATRNVVRTFLKKTGYHLIEASDTESAFRALREHADHIGAVICDLKIHNSNGICVLEQIRRDHGNLPVVVLTGATDLNIAVESMKKGAFDFISKPTTKDELILTIEKALNHKILLDDYIMLKKDNDRYRRCIEHIQTRLSNDHPNTAEQLNTVRQELLNLNNTLSPKGSQPA
jgi:DNA-binding NtrC family response regulator